MTQDEISITGEPITDAMCRFSVGRPVYPDKSFYFGSKEQAEVSPFANRLFEIEGIRSVQITHDQVTIVKSNDVEWPVIGKQIGTAIRAFFASDETVVPDEMLKSLPSSEEIKLRVSEVLETEINPQVASHGGVVKLIDVKDNVVYIQMGGGCQGCGQADVTLKYGIETAIRASVDGVGAVLDVTDHASGRNPYYVASTK